MGRPNSVAADPDIGGHSSSTARARWIPIAKAAAPLAAAALHTRSGSYTGVFLATAAACVIAAVALATAR